MVNDKMPFFRANLFFMISTLIQMAALIGCGVIWRQLQPAGLDAKETRLVLTTVVYYLLLPAMVLLVLVQADIGVSSLQFSVIGVSSVLFGMSVSWLTGQLFNIGNVRLGAVILAASFPNLTYLGLPVLEQTFGSWARSIAIQLDLFAAAPMLFTLGLVIAAHYGTQSGNKKISALASLNAPPFWAAAVAVMLNINHVVLPETGLGILTRLADAVVPLMLFSLGLALDWQAVKWSHFPFVLPVIVIKLLLMPLFVIGLLHVIDLDTVQQTAVILEMAMPSMVLGLVFCDRYRLDTSLYAMAVTVTTVLSLLTLPFWYRVSV